MSRAKNPSKTCAQVGERPQPIAPPGTGPFLTGKKLNAVLCVLLAAATIALYSPVHGYSFIEWDADDLVTGNPHIQGGLGWSTIQWAFTSTDAWNWQPLTWLSHALDYQLFALSPGGHHLDSVLIHALNAVLLFLLFAWVTKRVGPSLLVAALFAVHPINVQSVVWVTERKNVLSTLFFLLAIAAYVRYAQKPDWRRYLLVAALFAAGLMAKPMVITLPFVLLLLDYWPLERTPLDRTPSDPADSNCAPRVALSTLVLEKVPLLFLSALSAIITVKAQGNAVRGLQQFPLAVRIENAAVAYGLYLWKMLWPVRLALLYPHPRNTLPAGQWILSALVLFSVTALVVAFRSKGYLPVGWFWFLGTLVPVIGLVQVGEQAMADRYAYVPLIGIFVMIAWGIDDWAEAHQVRTVWRVIPALCALAALGFVTSRQMSYWDSDYDLWAHALAVTDRNPYAHDALGSALMSPDLGMTAKNLAGLDTEQKRMDEARRHWTQALELNRQLLREHPDLHPQHDMAVELNNLGFLDRRQNRMNEAGQHYEEALSIYRQLAQQNPDVYVPHLGTTLVPSMALTLDHLALVEKLQQRLDEARQHDEEALKIDRQLVQQDPDKYRSYLPATLINLGNLDLLQNRTDDGRQHYEEALKIQSQLAQQNPDTNLPDMVTALNNLGNLDLHQNRTDDARQNFERALDLRRQLAQRNPDKYLPELAGALNNLGKLDGSQQRMDDARQNFEGALKIYRQLAQQHPDAHLQDMAMALNNLGFLDRLQNRIERIARLLYGGADHLPKARPGQPGEICGRRGQSRSEFARTRQESPLPIG